MRCLKFKVQLKFYSSLLGVVPHFTDTQSLARDTPYCARSTLDIVVQARQSMVCAPVRSIIPSLKLGDYLSVQAHNPCSISHLLPKVSGESLQIVLLDSCYNFLEYPFLPVLRQKGYGIKQGMYSNVWISTENQSTSGRQSMGCAPVRRDNPRALARGLSTVQAHKPCSISLVPQ